MTLGLQRGGFASGRRGGKSNIKERVLEYAFQLCWLVMIVAGATAVCSARACGMVAATGRRVRTLRRDGGRRF
jgi:hypothetical protein